VKGLPLERLLALAPVVVAAICTAVGVETSGWGRSAPMNGVEAAPLLPPRPPLSNGDPPPPKSLITPIHGAARFVALPSAKPRDGGAPDAP
jgi:hypothetical protein